MDEHKKIEHEYQGRTWVLPVEMVELQLAWTRAHEACLTASNTDQLDRARAERLRLTLDKRRLGLSWRESFEAYDRWRADEALKHYARARLEQRGPDPS